MEQLLILEYLLILEQGKHFATVRIGIEYIRINAVIMLVPCNIMLDAWHGHDIVATHNKQVL